MHWKRWLLGVMVLSLCAGVTERASAMESLILKKSLLDESVLVQGVRGGFRGGFGLRSKGFGFSFRLGRGLKSHGFLHGRHGVFLVHPRQWGVFDGKRFFPVNRRDFWNRWNRRSGMAVHGRGGAYAEQGGWQTRAWSRDDLGSPGWEEDLGPSGWSEDLGTY